MTIMSDEPQLKKKRPLKAWEETVHSMAERARTKRKTAMAGGGLNYKNSPREVKVR